MYEDYSVLFVDDEPNILNSIRRSLLDEEYHCHFASSGKEALEIMKNEKIAVIVTDMRMPEMNGLELLTRVEEASPMTVKVVLSGYTQLPQILVTINQVDIFKFITKPWESEDFLKVIRKALDYFILRDESLKYKLTLEAKNKSYQNILKKINEVIDDATASRELIILCGKEILGFDKNFSTGEKIKFQNVFSLREKLFELFSKAITTTKKDMRTSEIILDISRYISHLFPEVSLEKNEETQDRFRINIKMMETAIDALYLIFTDEFRHYGLFCKISSGEQFNLAMIVPNADLNPAPKAVNERSVLDLKIELLQTVLGKLLELCHIKFQIAKVKGSLVIEIVPEKISGTEEEKKGAAVHEKNSDRG